MLNLHLAQLFDRIAIRFVQIDCLAQGSFCTGVILLAIEQGSSEQIVEIAVVGRFGDLRMGRGNRFIVLLLLNVSGHQAAKPIGRSRIFLERLLIELHRFAVMFLGKLHIAKLYVGSGILWRAVSGLFIITLRLGELAQA